MSPRYSNVTTSIRELIIRYASNNFIIIIFNPHKELQGAPQSFYRRKDNENVHQPLCIDYPNVTSGIRELSAKTYIKWINIIPHCHHGYSYARHTSSVLKSEIFNPTITKPQREKIRFITTKIEREETPYDPTILTKLAVHQDRAKSRTREREIKHIATGTNPQPRGWTTPSSSWRQPGWWRWPPMMIPPSGRVPKKGCRWDRGGTEACGGVKTHLG